MIHKKSLLAFDVDGTMSNADVPPDVEVLTKLLKKGVFVVVITGNTLDKLCETLLDKFIHHAAMKGPRLLERIFVFFQMGGALATFDRADIASLEGESAKHVYDALLCRGPDGSRRFRTEFLDSEYLRTCSINFEAYGNQLEAIWREDLAPAYQQLLSSKGDLYDLSAVEGYNSPKPNPRLIELDRGERISVQYTIRGFPSEFHKRPGCRVTAKNSIRAVIERRFNRALDERGLPLVAKVGGKSSIDVVLPDQDKARALEYAMERLHVPRASALYFGDELFPGGNDYSIPAELGVTCFSVRKDKRVGYHHRVFATETEGPAGAYLVLHELVAHSERPDTGGASLVESFKRRYMLDRIRYRFVSRCAANICSNVLQDLLTMVTIAFRDIGKEHTERQFDLLAQLMAQRYAEYAPMGAHQMSHPDV